MARSMALRDARGPASRGSLTPSDGPRNRGGRCGRAVDNRMQPRPAPRTRGEATRPGRR
jgi:hypothetical protein